MALHTPVAFFIFNRPDLTRRSFAAIARARPGRLLVVADGPRPGRNEEALCEAARAVVRNVDWPCEVATHYADANLGCRLRIASGLDWVFAQVPEAIIVEDDTLADPSFFPFCEELLERYRDEPRVQMISGCNLTAGRHFGSDSYYFSRFYHSWGWASWARAWKHYDIEMSRWPQLRETDWVERFLPTPGMARRARYFFDETLAGRTGTWDYQWVLAGWQQNALSVVSGTNLVTNIGFDTRATHTSDTRTFLANLAVQPMAFPLVHPHAVQVLEEADQHEWNLLNPRPSRARRLFNAIRRRLP